jgi:hypothetical protein
VTAINPPERTAEDRLTQGLAIFQEREPALVADRLTQTATAALAAGRGQPLNALTRTELLKLFTEYAAQRGFKVFELAWHWTAASEAELRDLQFKHVTQVRKFTGRSADAELAHQGISMSDLGPNFRLP